MRFFFGILFCLIVTLAKAQCPIVGFSTSNTACIEETLNVDNNSTGDDYKWELCPDNLANEITVVPLDVGNNIFRASFSINSFYYSNNWFGYVIRNNGLAYRFKYDFLTGQIQDVSFLNSINVSLPRDFQVIEFKNEWYGLITNSGAGNPTIVKFGSTPLNDTPIYSELLKTSNINNTNGLSFVKDGSNAYGFVGSNITNELHLLNFGNDLEVDPKLTTYLINGAVGIHGISMIRECDYWYGIVTSRDNSKVFRLAFINGIENTPQIDDITPNDPNFIAPAKVKSVNEGGSYFTFIQLDAGNIFRFEYGNSISNIPKITSINELSENSYAVDVINTDLGWKLLTVDNINLTKGLFALEFDNQCTIENHQSKEYEPSNLKLSAPGIYNLKLTVTNNDGLMFATTQSITISPSQAPQLQASSNGNCLSNPINFTAQQLSGDITAWNWDFGDGSGTSTLQNPAYSFGASGDYQVRLSVTDANGCNNLLIDTVSVYEEPIPDFAAPIGTLCMNNAILFTNTTTGESGPAVSWTWDFNGEGSSSQKEPSFTFLSSGNKTITLTSSIPGCANVIQKNIYVEVAPTTNFSYNNVCNTNETTFTDQTSGAGLTAWSWDFGDGFNSTDQNPAHTYTSPGQYQVVLTVSNNLGCSTSSTQTVFNHAVPTPAFQYDLPCSGTDVQFTDQSLVQDANLVAWAWDFGDPASSDDTSSLQNPIHFFNSPGNYDITLKSYSQFGCVDSLTRTVSVIQGPDVLFSWDQACEGEPTTFVDQTVTSGIPVTERIWIIEGVIYTDESPQHTFTTPGTYTISLGVTLSNLCGHVLQQDIVIENPLVPDFGYVEECKANEVRLFDLTNTSTGNPVVSRLWRIDGQLQTETDSAFIANLSPGSHEIVLTVISGANCEESTAKAPIEILGAPNADFSMNHDYGGLPLTVEFTNTSTGALNYTWFFGDIQNSTSNEINPTFTYDEEGVFEVKLISSNSTDCVDTSAAQMVEVVRATYDVLLESITPVESAGSTQFALTIVNPGTALLADNLEIIFQLDNSAEVIEKFKQEIYAEESLSYIPDFTIGNALDARSLCITLNVKDATNVSLAQDKDCLNLDEIAVITRVFPNPTADYFNIDVVIPAVEPIELSIIDDTGNLIFNNSYPNVRKGLNEFAIDARIYRDGLYVIQVKYQGLVKEMKAVVSK